MTLLLVLALGAVSCKPLTGQQIFCQSFQSLGCDRVWDEGCLEAYHRIQLERGPKFCPGAARIAGNCDELAALTLCGFEP